MEKKNPNTEQDIKKSSFESKKRKNSVMPNKNNDKRLPWWVELLFVQIGLPDKWLVKILKTKKKAQDLYKEEKKFIFTVLFLLFAIIYFQPVINYSRSKNKCQKDFKAYILKEKLNIRDISYTTKMLSVNFCNGGNEIDKVINK